MLFLLVMLRLFLDVGIRPRDDRSSLQASDLGAQRGDLSAEFVQLPALATAVAASVAADDHDPSHGLPNSNTD